MDNVIFIGGVHGSGKSSICATIAAELNLIHLSVSSLIKWDKEWKSIANKNVLLYQEYILNSIKKRIDPQKRYIIDGHFCLLKADGVIYPISEDIFTQLDPQFFIVLLEEPTVIVKRLEVRDNKKYQLEFIREFQDQEFEHAMKISQHLHKEILISNTSKIDILIRKIKERIKEF